MDSNYVDDLIDDDEIPELTEEDFAKMVPFSALPAGLQHILSEIQRGNVTFRPEGEERVPVPVSRSVVERFRVSGSGWEGRVDAGLAGSAAGELRGMLWRAVFFAVRADSVMVYRRAYTRG